MDGLLGIGAAGGKSSAASEGAMLASRLETLRKERSMRKPEDIKKDQSIKKEIYALTFVSVVTGMCWM